MKRYALFRGANYYPHGGWFDFGGWFDTPEDALAAYAQWWESREDFHPLNTYDRWAHLLDTASWTIIAAHDGDTPIEWGAPPIIYTDED